MSDRLEPLSSPSDLSARSCRNSAQQNAVFDSFTKKTLIDLHSVCPGFLSHTTLMPLFPGFVLLMELPGSVVKEYTSDSHPMFDLRANLSSLHQRVATPAPQSAILPRRPRVKFVNISAG
jgi:hypothetical protein